MILNLSKVDIVSCLITGLITGLIAWRLLVFWGRKQLFGWSFFWLIFLVPLIWLVGVEAGFILGRYLSFFTSFGRFCVIGFSNAAVDFGILNLLIYIFSVARGMRFSIFKGLSFSVAFIHSFFWNKYWVFQAGGSGRSSSEFFHFFIVAIFALCVNVGVSSYVVNKISSKFGINEKTWASVGAAVGSAAALLFSFVGFRLLVFK